MCLADGTATLLCNAPPPNLDVLKPGYILNHRYQLEKELGRGGFGAVFAARHTGTGQKVAVKVLFSAGDRNSLKRFFREARVTAQLKSKHTIRVYDFGQDDSGMAYLAMELLTGQPLIDVLNDRLRQGRVFSEREAIDVAVAVCKSLNEAHAAGLVHRDLKPHNIFAAEDEDGIVYKVLDFGIAKTADQSLTGGHLLGTVSYMSPEQAQNHKLDGRSDLYSLGILLYQLVAGAVPLQAETPIQTLMLHMSAPPPPLAERSQVELTERFIGTIERLLSKEPDARYATAADLVAALDPLRALANDTSRVKQATVIAGNADLFALNAAQEETIGADGAGGTDRYRAPQQAAAKFAPQADATAGLPAGALHAALPLVSDAPVAAALPVKWIVMGAVAVVAIAIAALTLRHGDAPVVVPAAPAPAAALAPAPAAALAPAVAPPPGPTAAAPLVLPPAAPTPAAANGAQLQAPIAVPAAPAVVVEPPKVEPAKAAAPKKRAEAKPKTGGSKSSLDRDL